MASWTAERKRQARALAERLAGARQLRRHRPPPIRTGPAGREPTIYYLCPDYSHPSGGIRVIYRHVDILNRAGRRAAVLHHREGYECRWFEHSTPTVGAASVTLSPDDVLVVPEVYGPFLERLPRERRLVVFNQNAYKTYEQVPAGKRLAYDVFSAALVVSEDSAEFLRFAFPGLDVTVIVNSVDPEVFHPAPQAPPKRLALMPRKRPEEAEQILRMLGDRLRGWEVVRIDGAGERETAAALRSAPIFLALGRTEGFGMPPVEAMASGGYVVGFPGLGGREIFDPAFSTPVEDGDVLTAARELARLLDLYESQPAVLREAGERAREHVRERYSLQRQSSELLAFYDRLG